jgi:hypothetical protein
MYLYTILGAGGFGLATIIAPDALRSLLGWPAGEPIALSIVSSVYAAFGIVSILGLRSPLRFAPVLLLQLGYKSVWFVGVAVPLLVCGRFPRHAVATAIIFATYVIGDLIAIPFPYLFTKEQPSAPGGKTAHGAEAVAGGDP